MQSTTGHKLSSASVERRSDDTQSPNIKSARPVRNFSEEALNGLMFAVNSNDTKSHNDIKNNALLAGSITDPQNRKQNIATLKPINRASNDLGATLYNYGRTLSKQQS